MKPRFIQMYMEIAGIISKQSSAKRLQVGAIVVKDDRIISIGYNGMPAGWTNECEEKEWIIGNIPNDPFENKWIFKEEDSSNMYRMKTKKEVIHAEANAIAKLARSPESGEGSTMFLTHAPCLDCAKQMYAVGINKVYFRDHYKYNDGITFLEQCGIEVKQWNIGENT